MGLEGGNMGIEGGIDVEDLKKGSHVMKAEENKETNNIPKVSTKADGLAILS